jgi:pimeloyl-ACP methyl ester carboxylesterase
VRHEPRNGSPRTTRWSLAGVIASRFDDAARPVSGRHVLELAVKIMPDAAVTELAGVGHFPSSEAPQAVAAAVRMHR